MINSLDVQFVMLEQGEKKIYAASDLILVLSVFEPCALSQLIA